MLTKKQRRLVELMDYRAAHNIPTTRRNLAEVFGIRTDSLKKLLSRTRKRMAAEGRELPRIHRMKEFRFRPVSLWGKQV